MSRLSESDLQQFRSNLQRGKHPLKAIDTILKQKGPKFRSKWEESFAYDLVLQKRTNMIQDYGYETMSLTLGNGRRYRPDFTIWHLDGSIECAEIKGHHPNIRDSLTHLAWAAQQHPWFRFTIKRRAGGGWESSEVRP